MPYIEDRVSTVEADIAEIKGDVGEIKDRIGVVERAVGNMELRLNRLDENVAALTAGQIEIRDLLARLVARAEGVQPSA
ncbi:hypothetical protein SAMN05421505_11440 [Sinosporangium album]|uniref:Uncharacterized protein n=1 Tax=Sinosporangium album TaxID=504805 RepID=A0A1G8BH41_9ACTN|nr:hypothetical protein [Sinosporangium album]SDH32384.1 hypothetical protein SAMN05421505_11440 [Sinosporangium album]